LLLPVAAEGRAMSKLLTGAALAALLCGLCGTAPAADAATFYLTPIRTHWPYTEKAVEVRIVGAIEQGDDSTFSELVAKLKQNHTVIDLVSFASPGGNVSAAAAMADLVAAMPRTDTIIRDDNDFCLSACVMIFYAGRDRTVDEPGHHLGVHRASGKDGRETDVSREGSLFIADKLASFGVARSTTNKLLVTPASKITWLDGTDGDFCRLYCLQGSSGQPYDLPPECETPGTAECASSR
jgi:hypothetical protein